MGKFIVLVLIMFLLTLFVLTNSAAITSQCTVITRVWEVVREGDGDYYLGFESNLIGIGCVNIPVLGEIEKENLTRIPVPKYGNLIRATGPVVRDVPHKLWVMHPIQSLKILEK